MVVLQSRHNRPAIVAARLDQVHFIVRVRAVLTRVEPSVAAEVKSLRVAVAVSVYVAADAAEHRVVIRNGTVQIEAKGFAGVK